MQTLKITNFMIDKIKNNNLKHTFADGTCIDFEYVDNSNKCEHNPMSTTILNDKLFCYDCSEYINKKDYYNASKVYYSDFSLEYKNIFKEVDIALANGCKVIKFCKEDYFKISSKFQIFRAVDLGYKQIEYLRDLDNG